MTKRKLPPPAPLTLRVASAVLGMAAGLLLGVLLTPAPPPMPTKPELEAMTESARVVASECPPAGSVVSLLISEGRYGSATVVDCRPVLDHMPESGYTVTAVTCWHVVEGAERLTPVHVEGGRRVGWAWIEAANEAEDLAVIRFHSLDALPALALADSAPARGDEVVSHGYSLTGHDGPLWSRRGMWCGDNRLTDGLYPGASGGPVMRSGKVVGLVRGYFGTPDMSFVVTLDALRSVLGR